jgi:hypothetical protein
MDESTHTSGSKGSSGIPKAKCGITPTSPTPTGPTPPPPPPPPQVCTPTHGSPGSIGTPTPPPPVDTPTPPPSVDTPTSSASTTASCYHYRSSPIDNLMGVVDIDEDNDSNEIETDRSSGSMRGRGGRPPLPKKRKTKKVAKPSIVWEHYTKDLNSPEVRHTVTIVRLRICVMQKIMGPLTCCIMSRLAKSTGVLNNFLRKATL